SARPPPEHAEADDESPSSLAHTRPSSRALGPGGIDQHLRNRERSSYPSRQPLPGIPVERADSSRLPREPESAFEFVRCCIGGVGAVEAEIWSRPEWGRARWRVGGYRRGCVTENRRSPPADSPAPGGWPGPGHHPKNPPGRSCPGSKGETICPDSGGRLH